MLLYTAVALASGSRVRASLQSRGRLAVRAGLQTSRPTHPSAPVYHTAASSPVIHFSFIQLSSTSWRVISGLNTSSDTHMKYILLAHIIFVKEQFIFALVCNIVYAGQLFTTKAMAVSWMYNSRHHYNVLVSYHAIKIDEYMCKPPFCRPVYINMMW